MSVPSLICGMDFILVKWSPKIYLQRFESKGEENEGELGHGNESDEEDEEGEEDEEDEESRRSVGRSDEDGVAFRLQGESRAQNERRQNGNAAG